MLLKNQIRDLFRRLNLANDLDMKFPFIPTYAGQPPTVREEQGLRIAKMASEAGEAVEAWITFVGQNPRKPTVALERVQKEIMDTAVTAMIALSAFSDDPIEDIAIHFEMLRQRAEAEYVSRKARDNA